MAGGLLNSKAKWFIKHRSTLVSFKFSVLLVKVEYIFEQVETLAGYIVQCLTKSPKELNTPPAKIYYKWVSPIWKTDVRRETTSSRCSSGKWIVCLLNRLYTNEVTNWTLGWRKDIFVSKTLQQVLPQPPAALHRTLCKCLLTMKIYSFSTGNWDHLHQEGDYKSKEKHGQTRMNLLPRALSQFERWTSKHLQLATVLSKLWYYMYSRQWVMSMLRLLIILTTLRSRQTSPYICYDYATYSRLYSLQPPKFFMSYGK